MTDRKVITKFLSEKLITEKFSKWGQVYSQEVVLDYGTTHSRRIDFIQYCPEGTTFVSDIEQGVFVCYEVKSCIEDVYSGNGLNFEGDKNYIVTTMECYKTLIKDMNQTEKFWHWFYKKHPEYSHIYNIGIMVAIPKYKTAEEEFENPTPLTNKLEDWKLITIIPARKSKGARRRSRIELLFCMLRAK